MARKRVVEIRGMDELLRKLRTMQADLSGALATKAARAGSEVLKSEMRLQVPKRRPELVFHIEDDVAEQKTDRSTLHVGPDADHFYGGILEVTGDPWMRPALDAREDDVVDAIADVLKDAVLRHAR